MRNPSPFIKRMYAAGVMPIFFNPDEKKCLKMLEVAYEGGIRVIEMVDRGKEAKSIFPALRKAADQMPGLYLGVGTIYEPKQAETFLDMGAEFIVAPVMNPKLGEYCKKLDIPWIPGCGTVSEIYFAQQLGAELAKIYPANILGTEFVKSVHAVLPTIELIPTGGVEPTAESLKSWFDAGVCCVGMGSQLFRKDLVEKGDFEEIKKKIQFTMDLIKSLRA
ncbi:2-dehydro-3-deoxyphosphogluconate aldolase/(4S)-4-hydroxy-2-oxoglutarate aldolase [Algoriphagus iocasae]|jgi:2-dehydro-3-deoxyphosphogluconate aldolase / (4S)-4-hydroxy-2-oxoglutarate aldolase|uniref:2-dehydro-3-deoxyphosphogluconate aldolase/(4S)-4-hydroxy-2-oxoglutarate aldolase n=1 Tax=Algoriphagus iocasae TaxID=1836499 RepID=A0A841N084_9BACT|nr:bifunctional 4-hydroxy-2-oxoglutarate aldolase/2-dehydro-3-deoxy-phosphogluconate aldolase [Algoriphagus iocasae]MBB6328318.1 2-dehydro-3-deoxyphosphogluconate aldolase/(4S)-4-hydroxy-2-oxoglutarate aldolase [Algoriphagus iocasae]